jgi:hypothetical protein
MLGAVLFEPVGLISTMVVMGRPLCQYRIEAYRSPMDRSADPGARHQDAYFCDERGHRVAPMPVSRSCNP